MENNDQAFAEERTALQKLVESEGWRIFVRNTQAQLDTLRKHGWTSITTMEKLHYARGCMDTMQNLIGFEKLLEAANQAEMDLGQDA